MKAKIAILPGDGIGHEVVPEGVKVLKKIAQKFNHEFEFEQGVIGGTAIDKTGEPLPKETTEKCEKCDAVLFGAVGNPKFDKPGTKVRPEQGLLQIRKHFDLFANLRPIKVFDQLIDSSPLKKEVVQGANFIFFRELTSGIYFGEPRERQDNDETAIDTMLYRKNEIERIARLAFEGAQIRGKGRGDKGKVTLVHKANVLESSRLWKEVTEEVAKEFKDVEYEDALVDSTAMHLIQNPKHFDVIVTSNMFGDILSDESGVIPGSIGTLPSASLNSEKFGLYEPIHGSAPDIAGQNKANPIATILSVAMLLRYTLNLEEEAKAIENAVEKVLDDGKRTADIAKEGEETIGTKEMGNAIVEKV